MPAHNFLLLPACLPTVPVRIHRNTGNLATAASIIRTTTFWWVSTLLGG